MSIQRTAMLTFVVCFGLGLVGAANQANVNMCRNAGAEYSWATVEWCRDQGYHVNS